VKKLDTPLLYVPITLLSSYNHGKPTLKLVKR